LTQLIFYVDLYVGMKLEKHHLASSFCCQKREWDPCRCRHWWSVLWVAAAGWARVTGRPSTGWLSSTVMVLWYWLLRGGSNL